MANAERAAGVVDEPGRRYGIVNHVDTVKSANGGLGPYFSQRQNVKGQYMKRTSSIAVLTIMGIIPGGFVRAAQPAVGQGATKPGYEANQNLQRYQRMDELMDMMQAEMQAMRLQMKQPGMSAKMRKQMAGQMKSMSNIMLRMSGLVDRPSMRDPDLQKQMDDMRREMDAMRRQHQTASDGK